MLTFVFPLSFTINNIFTYGLINYFQVSPKILDSVSTLTNSMIIANASMLYLNNYIGFELLNHCFNYSQAYLVCDTIFNYYYNINNNFYTKLFHHTLAIGAIFRLPYNTDLISLFYLSEYTNFPLEFRNLLINFKYDRFYVREICIVILYYMFLKLRIINPFRYIYTHYDDFINKYHKIDVILIFFVYNLWVYWFILINKKIYQKFLTIKPDKNKE